MFTFPVRVDRLSWRGGATPTGLIQEVTPVTDRVSASLFIDNVTSAALLFVIVCCGCGVGGAGHMSL